MIFLNTRLSIRNVISAMTVSLLIFSSGSIALAQVRPGHDEEKVKLVKDEGYTIKRKSDGKYYVNILRALNPKDGKELDGTHRLEYYCQKAVAAVFISVVLAKGYAESVLRCKPDERPFLWLYLNLGG